MLISFYFIGQITYMKICFIFYIYIYVDLYMFLDFQCLWSFFFKCIHLFLLASFTQTLSYTCHCSFFLVFLLSWMQRNSIITLPPPSCRYSPPTSRPATSVKTTCCPKRTLCLQRRARVGTRQRHWLSPADHRLSSVGQQCPLSFRGESFSLVL